jgi:hypothetical protein
MGGILHGLSDDARDLPFSNNVAAERWIPSREGGLLEDMQFHSALGATGLFSHFPHQFNDRFYHVARPSRGRNTWRWTSGIAN